MEIDQTYRVRRVQLESEGGGQFASLTLAPVLETAQQSPDSAARNAVAGGANVKPQDFTITGIPVKSLGDISLDTKVKLSLNSVAE